MRKYCVQFIDKDFTDDVQKRENIFSQWDTLCCTAGNNIKIL